MVRDKPDPGHFIRQQLEARGWTAGHLTQFLNRPAREISEIIAGYREITPEIAAGLAKAFDTTPQYWLNHQMAWDLLQSTSDD